MVEWSAAMLEPLAKEKLKSTERQAKLDKLRLWVNFVPAPSNSVAVRDDNFTGVVSCTSSLDGLFPAIWRHCTRSAVLERARYLDFQEAQVSIGWFSQVADCSTARIKGAYFIRSKHPSLDSRPQSALAAKICDYGVLDSVLFQHICSFRSSVHSLAVFVGSCKIRMRTQRVKHTFVHLNFSLGSHCPRSSRWSAVTAWWSPTTRPLRGALWRSGA